MTRPCFLDVDRVEPDQDGAVHGKDPVDGGPAAAIQASPIVWIDSRRGPGALAPTV